MASTSDLAKFDDYLTVGDAAKMLGVSPWTLRNWDNAGKLSSARHPVTGYRIYHPDDLQALLRNESLRGKQTRLMAPNLDWDEIGDTEHFVQFYEHDSFLIESVSKYIGRAIVAGDGALIIATAESPQSHSPETQAARRGCLGRAQKWPACCIRRRQPVVEVHAWQCA